MLHHLLKGPQLPFREWLTDGMTKAVDCTRILSDETDVVGIRRGWKQMKRCVDKLSKSTSPSLAPITVFVISGLQSVIYWKNFCHVWWVSYGLYVINCICTLMRAVFWHTWTFSDYINRLCRHCRIVLCFLNLLSDNLLACSRASMR